MGNCREFWRDAYERFGAIRILSVKSWVEISEERLVANYEALARAAGAGVAVLAVLKANAYGHGAELCAPVLARAEWFGVADVAEGVAVRAALTAAGVNRQPRILVMCGLLAEDAHDVVRHKLTPVVWNRQQMEWLAAAAERLGMGDAFPVHLEVDTGMARQGVPAGPELEQVLAWLAGQRTLRLDGVATHFACAEVPGALMTVEQRKRFEQALRAVSEARLRPEWVHAGSSSTIDNLADANLAWLRGVADAAGARAMVRPGIGLYGYCLPIEGTRSHVCDELKPVMTWKTRVMSLQDLNPGDTVGYNATFVAQRPMRLAVLPVGYSDGLRRELSGSNDSAGGWVMVRGQRAAIVGRVSMNLTVVDVTKIPEVVVGDEVVLLGEGVTADDHARLAHTISYEILCGVKSHLRLHRADR
jgi:alanine racemase